VSAAPAHASGPTTTAALSPAAFWALLPATERDRLGLRLSRLVIKAVRSPAITPQEDR
jgi:hypothetical protein